MGTNSGSNEPQKKRIRDVLEETFARYEPKETFPSPPTLREEPQCIPSENKPAEPHMTYTEISCAKVVSTGIVGFDSSIGGGIPDHNLILTCGENGSHYDTLVQQILYNHMIENGKVAYYLGETLSIDIKRNMEQFNWTLQDHIRKGSWKFIDMRTQNLQELADLCPKIFIDESSVKLTPSLSDLKSDLLSKIKDEHWTVLELNLLLFNYTLREIVALILYWRALIRVYGGIHFLILPLDIHAENQLNALKNLTDVVIEFRLKESVREYENVMTIRKIKNSLKPLMLHFEIGKSGIVIETVARIA